MQNLFPRFVNASTPTVGLDTMPGHGDVNPWTAGHVRRREHPFFCLHTGKEKRSYRRPGRFACHHGSWRDFDVHVATSLSWVHVASSVTSATLLGRSSVLVIGWV